MLFGCRPPRLQRGSRTEEEAVDETYRMLGREHELDLAREARKHGLAAAVGADGRATRPRVLTNLRKRIKRPDWVSRVPGRLAALLR
jgi:hypothetical protein